MFSDVRRNVGMVLVLLLVVTIIYCFVSPAPRSLLTLLLFDKDARMKREAMAEAIPEVDVKIYTDLVYGDMDDALLDIYVPNNTQENFRSLSGRMVGLGYRAIKWMQVPIINCLRIVVLWSYPLIIAWDLRTFIPHNYNSSI